MKSMRKYGFQKVDLETAVFQAKRMLVDSIWKEANIEVPGITFPTTNSLFEGYVPSGIETSTVLLVNNLKHAWSFIIDNIEERVNTRFLSRLNEELGSGHLIQYAGYYRIFPARISGTKWRPADSIDEQQVEKVVDKIYQIVDPIDRALSAFCIASRSQWFMDGNKRVAQLWANHILIKEGVGTLAVPVEKRVDFEHLLIDFYESGDSKKVKNFLSNHCLDVFDE